MKVIVGFLVIFFGVISCSKTKNNQKLISNNAPPYLYKELGNALGTTYNILYFSDKKITKIENSLDSLFLKVNRSMSTYLPNSDISKINNGDTTVVVDQMFKDVFKISKQINKNTSGYFDPTVGKLVSGWGFGSEKLKLKMNPKTVDSLMQYVGFSKLALTAQSTIKKQHPNIVLDFNAVAKGYCIDRIAAFFNAKKINNYLIELGGELVAKGKHLQKKTSWTVGIDDPNQTEKRTLIATLSLNNKAMATSGNYRKFRVDSITGKKYVHTINALTGYTQVSNILSVSVLANNCAIADAYATAFMAMPLELSQKILASNKDLEAYILYSTTNNNINSYKTEGFKKVLK